MNRILTDAAFISSRVSELSPGRRICVVTAELEGPFFNGGVGTANRALAMALRALGYELDILYTRVEKGNPTSLRGTFSDHVDAYRKMGIRLLCIDHAGQWAEWQAQSYAVLQHLLQHRYALVFFDDLFGSAYYPLLARRTGCTALRGTKMCVTAHSALEWVTELNQTSILDVWNIALLEMERRSIELADAVKAPSAYILGKYRSYGWSIPENFIVMPNFVSSERSSAEHRKRVAVKEIVFFGRLETRKGLWLFCRALDRLKFKLGGCVVTFLGKSTPEIADILLRRSAAWPFTIHLMNNLNREQALAYLKGDGRLAIMPSPEDNSPSAIIECLEEGIPFLATSGSGGEELLDEQSRRANLFEPSVDNLCAKIMEALAEGGATAGASYDHAQLHHSFAEWLENLLKFEPPDLIRKSEKPAPGTPVLLVVVPPEYAMDQAIAELRRAVETFDEQIEVRVLAGDADALLKHLDSESDLSCINIAKLSDFGEIAKSLAPRDATVVGICHISQMLSPVWVERARICFATHPDISALTGMVGRKLDVKGRGQESYVSAADYQNDISRYLVGYAPPMFPLGQNTNSGFALLRSELLDIASRFAPVDERYGRLKRMEDWIHEILVTAHIEGHRFELVPDQIMDRALDEVPFEAFRAEHFRRSLASKMYGYAPDTDQWAMTRLAIDTGLESEQSRVSAEYRSHLAMKLGIEVSPINADTSSEQHFRQLAMIAHANGQIELAADFASALALPGKKSTLFTLKQHVRSAVKAVKLVDLISNKRYAAINLDHPWSLKIIENGTALELHANPAGEGRATLAFDSVDLSATRHFGCILKLPSEDARPVRIRIDLISRDQAEQWSAEKILRSGQASGWMFEIPESLRTSCSVLLAVEMADQRDSANNAFLWILDPRFS